MTLLFKGFCYRYYPALKTLEQLEHVHLPAIANYRFSLQIRENIPQLRDKIKEAAMSDLKDFLENIRKFSQKIGEVAMSHTSEQLTSSSSILGKKKPNAPNSFMGTGNEGQNNFTFKAWN